MLGFDRGRTNGAMIFIHRHESEPIGDLELASIGMMGIASDSSHEGSPYDEGVHDHFIWR